VQNLNQRLTVPRTGDELQRLSETLNEMMASLDSAFKKITQFTADASHELRTPVALIRTTAELALRKQRSEVDYREALQQIRAESERTTALIENLMTLARADSGVDTLPLVSVDLAKPCGSVPQGGDGCAGSETGRVRFRLFLTNVSPWMVIHQSLRRLFLILMITPVKVHASWRRIVVSLNTSDGFRNQ